LLENPAQPNTTPRVDQESESCMQIMDIVHRKNS
jgi:hypothetical protein